MTNEALNRFGGLEGIGPNMAKHLWDIGMRTKMDIAAGDPEEMYKKDCELKGGILIGVSFMCIVSAETQNKTIEPALHKWWNWSDPRIEQRHLKLQS